MRPLILLALLGLVACGSPTDNAVSDHYDLREVTGTAPVGGTPDGWLTVFHDGRFRLAMWSEENEEPRQADFTGTYLEAGDVLTLTVTRFCTAHTGTVSTCPASPVASLAAVRSGSTVTVTAGTAWSATFVRK
ncbi:MAG TPA: hypothetical protein VFZ21_29510 [Gemmatimonadaceae bacterium]|nr:hypothetical protein [Gemmatimonadaceae bacterium]